MDRYIEGHGLIIDGHDLTRAEARARAQQWLRDHGASDWDADTSDAAVSRGWWAGDEAGFCTADHPEARPVLVVRTHAGEG